MFTVKRTKSISYTDEFSIKILCATLNPTSLTERFTLGSLRTKLATVRQTYKLPTPISVKLAP